MRVTKSLQIVGILLAGIVGWSRADAPADTGDAKPGVFEAAAASLRGTVESIDYNTRMVTLKGQDGKTVTFQVGPAAVRFNEVKVGDVVTADYLVSVAVMVQSPSDSVSSAMGSSTVLIRNKSKMPSATAVQTDVVTATVVKINAAKRTAVLKGPQGNEFKVNIAPDVQHVENVKKGDQVLVKVTHTLAVNVTKGPQ